MLRSVQKELIESEILIRGDHLIETTTENNEEEVEVDLMTNTDDLVLDPTLTEMIGATRIIKNQETIERDHIQETTTEEEVVMSILFRL